jgi:hypothetical protein
VNDPYSVIPAGQTVHDLRTFVAASIVDKDDFVFTRMFT